MYTKTIVFLAFVALAAAQGKKSQETSTPVPILKQISKVNDDGSYTYGYESADGTFKVETRDKNGSVKGKYGYVDDQGELKVVEYSAGDTGFTASGDHLPEPVPEVPAPRPVAPQRAQPAQNFAPQQQQFQPQPQRNQQFQQQPQQFQQQPQQFPQQQQQQFFPQQTPQNNFNNFNNAPQNVPSNNFNGFPAGTGFHSGSQQQVPQNFNNNNGNTGAATRNRGFSFSFDAPVVSAPAPQQFNGFQQSQPFNSFPQQFNNQF